MAFTQNQLDSFFSNNPQQMALPANVPAIRLGEGLTTIADFNDFKEDQLDAAFRNMHTVIPGTPGIPAVQDANGVVINNVVPAIPPILPCLVSARCKLRLNMASVAYHYYESVQRAVTPANMNYSSVLQNFKVEYNAITELAKGDKPDVPILTKTTTPLKWIESFKDCLYRTYGIQKTPLSYVTHKDVVSATKVDDPLQARRAFGESESVIEELIVRLNHNDPLFANNNAMIYSMLEESNHGTVYASTVKPYSRRKDGRGTWFSMLNSKEKWEKLFKDRSRFIMNNKWNGRTFSLEKFTGIHRSAFVQMQEANDHVDSDLQLPSEHTCIGYLLVDNIDHNDADLLHAALANIRMDMNGMHNNFEGAVSHMLPVDPYTKSKKQSGKSVIIA